MSELINCINNLSAKDIIKSIAKTANGTPFYLQTSGLGGFCAAYQVVYDSLTTKPSEAIAAAQNTMCCALVDAGIWSKLDVFYLFAQTVNTASEALVNWKNPGTLDAVAFAAPAFVALEGFTGDGANTYINTNYVPNTHGVNYTQNNAGFGIYVRNNIGEGANDCGTIGVHDNFIRSRYNVDFSYGAVNQTSGTISAANIDSRGMFHTQRTASNALELFKNGVSLVAGVNASTGLSTYPFFVLASSNGILVPVNICTKQISLFYAGGVFSQPEITTFTNAFETYMDSNGKGVIP